MYIKILIMKFFINNSKKRQFTLFLNKGLLFITIIFINSEIAATTYTTIGCPSASTWSTFPAPFWNGATQLTSQPLDGDILVIAAGCTVSISGAISVTSTITINIYGQLKFPSTSDRLNMAAGSIINVYSGGSITAASNSNQIKIGPGSADWSGPGTLSGPAAVTTAGSGSTLPVELLEFTGTCIANGVQLNWITATEINNDYFLIEKSNDGYGWEQIAKIKGLANSYAPTKYIHNDYTTQNNLTYYRISQTDIGGQTTIFKAIDVYCSDKDIKDQIILYPNPSSTELNIVLSISKLATNTSITLVNNTGQLMFETKVDLVKGVNSFALPFDIPSGAYTVLFSSNDVVIPSQKLMVINP